MRLPSRIAITALRQTFLSGILKAYIDLRSTLGESFKAYSYPRPDSNLLVPGLGPMVNSEAAVSSPYTHIRILTTGEGIELELVLVEWFGYSWGWIWSPTR